MKRLFFLSILGFVVLACSGLTLPAPSPNVESATATLGVSTPAPTQLNVPALTVDQLVNASYHLEARDDHPTVQLTKGEYQSATTDPASVDYAVVKIVEPVALGDLNGDGLGDGAVLLAENYGGSGVFVSLIVMLNQGGQPIQVASELIDDRPIINVLSIQDGQIFLDATIHGINDPMCCATFSTRRTYRYQAGHLIMTSFSSKTPNGSERVISISHPADGDSFLDSWPLTLTGNVTVAPFENTLGYKIFDADNNQVETGSLMVQASQLGGPGSFSLPLDLSRIGTSGPARVQIEDLSPADGSLLALGSVRINIK